MSSRKKQYGIIKAIIILVAPILIGLFPTERAIACSCIMPGTPAEEIEKFDAVFMGTVTSISERSELFKTRLLEPVKIGIQVGQSWKGVTTDFVYVHTGYGGGDCGYPITGFETYLFYAYGPIDDLGISICSRTAVYREAQEDRSYLEQLQELPLTHVVSLAGNAEGVNILLAGTTILLLVGVSYLLVKNKQMRKKNNPQP